MKWQGRRQSDNVEDRRGVSRGGKMVVGGGVLGIVILLLNLFGGETGKMIIPVLEQVNQSNSQEETPSIQRSLTAEEKEMGKFVATVFADTEDIFGKLSKENNINYRNPKMVLFTEAIETACGSASSASGPFYCPGDEKVYMDLTFFEELRTRFGAKGGDFATAYVIAHEVGHHLQTVIGTSNKVRQLQQKTTQEEGNRLSVALELQADFYAGVWAKHNQKYLDPDDIDEALSAAQAVGDDAIQKRMQGYVVPESFTHGTSEQRKKWFLKGYQTGDLQAGDTFLEIK
ncbi:MULTISPECIES: neutral zinc metallopeptidase [Flavobacterium]|uniref:Metalloprotease n=1 Tax=Flavobacterium columnare TaxID=996 RepID=A0AA94F406_9FLAO|nr:MULTISPECIES: neutral zinc metallopeptidase [Flavobacterium]MCH4830737.1 neutral zinc metallopeptidase [Flavobacterium columnare]MCH4833326.1 neutral zinc metallopeptidase [Flavobacterium columnare]QYS90992.1 neutral zinc metallopeptidase [Flavobacterium covae]